MNRINQYWKVACQVRVGMCRQFLVLLAFGLLIVSCKEKDQLFGEPYGPGPEGLGIRMDRSQAPVPALGSPGIIVTFKGTGFAQYRDEMVFRFNGQDAEIAEVTDDEIKVIVPDFASTGVTSVSIGDVVVFGPDFTVNGRINPDLTFRANNGTNGTVDQVLPLADGRNLVVGDFTNYDNRGVIRPTNRIVRTFPDGTYDASFRVGNAANGRIERVLPIGDKFFIAGAFGGFDQRTEHISNLTMLNSNGTIDTMAVSPFRRPDQADTLKYYPRFNGGFDGSVSAIYEHDGGILATGNFRYYISRQYDKPNRLEMRDSVIVDSVEIRQIARLNLDGTLDRSYRFETDGETPKTGANGPITTFMHTTGDLAGKLLVFGRFTRFDGESKPYLLRLNSDGSIDETFNPGGTGPDFNMERLTYNPVTDKYTIVGEFRRYNGQPAFNLAVLNSDGTLDESFNAALFEGGRPMYAKQLDDGMVVVSGGFRTYNGVTRNGFMVLDDRGNLVPGYNSTGTFSGTIRDIVETRSADNRRALLIIGNFNRFNSLPVNNIIRVTID